MTHANALDLNKQLPKMYTDYPSISMDVTPTMNIIALMVHGEYSTYVIILSQNNYIEFPLLNSCVQQLMDSLLKTIVISTMKTTSF